MAATEERIAFVSQPLKGVAPEDAKKRLEEMVEFLKTQGFKDAFGTEVKASLSEKNKDDKQVVKCPVKANPRVFWLGQSISKMAEANCLVLGPGWFTTDGCVVEKTVAEKYGMTIFFLKKEQDGWKLLKDQKSF